MNILIPSKYSESFIKELIAKINRDIRYKLFITDLSILDIWLRVEFNLNDNITCNKVIMFGLKNLKITKGSEYYKIEINPSKVYPNTNIRLITLLKTISYGNRYFKGNKILIDEFEEVNNNIDILYAQYERLGELF